MNAISLNLRQAADATGLSETFIRKAINKFPQEGGLPAKYAGTKLIIKVTDLDAWIDQMDNARK